MTTPEHPPKPTTVRTQMRTLAHPVRVRIVTTLARLTYARATDLARELDLPPNALSYHLRALAKGGIITEAPEQARDKRDRVWQLTTREGFTLDAQTATTEDASLSLGLINAQLDHAKSTWQLALNSASTDQPLLVPAKGSALLVSQLQLTPEQAEELRQKISNLIDSYETQGKQTANTQSYDFLLSLASTSAPPSAGEQ
ncbi:ArsR/SmtB family transcription factor [Rothia nasimurium]|uniref:ArsR/SmtB family transcription factor n=1 Tax=Rothia nasimurium TaxID=85336 RepID=UPI001F38E093|nr:winged helix-turn-helix domain-containing protein [Rothia nasimurium]